MRKHVLLLLLFFTCSMAHAVDEFVLKDMSGAEHRLSQYAGKWVIINYWATWCPPCLEEIPEFVALYDERKNKDVMVIGVVFDYSSIKTVSDYVDDMLISYSIVLGNDNIVKQIGPADVLPTTYLFNPKGVLVKVKRGLVSRQYLETVMREQ
ncbi:MAG: TlpA disulfide reductase family protein [Methylophilaceae bacterium]|nr:TlpA family protein disulfide reductase [Methylophilaceae bacterium]